MADLKFARRRLPSFSRESVDNCRCYASARSLAAGADPAGGQIGKERGHLVALELLAQINLAVSVHAVNLEYVLGQIEADCRNLHGGRSFRIEWLLTLPLWHIAMPLSGGGVHPIAYHARIVGDAVTPP
jgi:hypothetical protein